MYLSVHLGSYCKANFMDVSPNNNPCLLGHVSPIRHPSSDSLLSHRCCLRPHSLRLAVALARCVRSSPSRLLLPPPSLSPSLPFPVVAHTATIAFALPHRPNMFSSLVPSLLPSLRPNRHLAPSRPNLPVSPSWPYCRPLLLPSLPPWMSPSLPPLPPILAVTFTHVTARCCWLPPKQPP